MSTEGGGSPELPLKFEDIVDMYYDKMRPPKTHGELSNFISQDQIHIPFSWASKYCKSDLSKEKTHKSIPFIMNRAK